MSTSPGVHLSTKNSAYSCLVVLMRADHFYRWASFQSNDTRSPSKVHPGSSLSRCSRLTFGLSFPLPENEMIPKSVIDHKITDFSIIAVAASRAEGLSPDDLGKVISFPEASSDKAQRNDKRVEDSSDLSDYQYPPGSDAPAFIRERCSQSLSRVISANWIRPNRDFPDRRKRVKLSDTSTPPASLNVSKSADPEPLTKRKPENRNKRRRDAKYGDRNRKAETLTSTLPTMDASKFNISSTGWQGKNPRGIKNIQEIVKGWKDGTILIPLAKFLRIPHEG